MDDMPQSCCKRAISQLTFSFILLFLTDQLFANSPSRPNNLYYLTFHSESLSASELRSHLEYLNAQQAGKVPFGTPLKGRPYFHFYIPIENSKNLVSYLKKNGKMRLSGLLDHRKSRPGHQRFILWMQQNIENLPDISQSTIPASNEKFKPIQSQIKHVEQSQIAGWILDQVPHGPIDLDLEDNPSSLKKIYISSSLSELKFQRESNVLTIRTTPRKQNCAKIPTETTIRTEKDLQDFILEYGSCYSFHFDRTNPQQKSLKVNIVHNQLDALVVLANESEIENGHLETEVQNITSAPDIPVETENTFQQDTEPDPSSARLRALGSLLQTSKSFVLMGELGVESYYGRKGLGLRYFQISPDAPTNSKMSSVDLIAGYRLFQNDLKAHKSLFPHFIYRSMSIQNIGGSFYGLGLNYQNNFWPAINRFMDDLQWLPPDTTVEMSFEYFPWTTTGNVNKLTGYSGYLRALLHYTSHLSIELGMQYQAVTFTKNDFLTDQKLFYFQAGLSLLIP
jgi:hypothetical protein